MENFIQTFKNHLFNFNDPSLDSICIEDIAHALSNQCRFAGHTSRFYSVAEHSINVARLVNEGQELAGLLHDASEAYLTDIPSPIKQYLPDYTKMEDKVQTAIAEKFEIEYPFHDSIHAADKACLITESQVLLTVGKDHWSHNYYSEVELPRLWVIGMPPETAERYFLMTYDKIRKGTYGTSNAASKLYTPQQVRSLSRGRKAA